MTKRQLIDEIVTMNRTVEPRFLARFDDDDLSEYLDHLRLARQPRLSGNAGRYEKYFVNCPTIPVTPHDVSAGLRPPNVSGDWRGDGTVPAGGEIVELESDAVDPPYKTFTRQSPAGQTEQADPSVADPPTSDAEAGDLSDAIDQLDRQGDVLSEDQGVSPEEKRQMFAWTPSYGDSPYAEPVTASEKEASLHVEADNDRLADEDLDLAILDGHDEGDPSVTDQAEGYELDAANADSVTDDVDDEWLHGPSTDEVATEKPSATNEHEFAAVETADEPAKEAAPASEEQDSAVKDEAPGDDENESASPRSLQRQPRAAEKDDLENWLF